MGHEREDLTPYAFLFWPVGAFLIIYSADRRPIEIVAVTQGSRDCVGASATETALEDALYVALKNRAQKTESRPSLRLQPHENKKVQPAVVLIGRHPHAILG